jgi:hypothetical protein
MSGRGLNLPGRDAPGLNGQCDRIPSPRHWRVRRAVPAGKGPRLLSVAATRYRVGTFFFTPSLRGSQEEVIAEISASPGRHPEGAVEPDDLAVEHGVVDDVLHQGGVLDGSAQA